MEQIRRERKRRERGSHGPKVESETEPLLEVRRPERSTLNDKNGPKGQGVAAHAGGITKVTRRFKS